MRIEAFRNKAGGYILLSIEDGKVRYRFTSRAGRVAEAKVPVPIWDKMAAKGEPRTQEAA